MQRQIQFVDFHFRRRQLQTVLFVVLALFHRLVQLHGQPFHFHA